MELLAQNHGFLPTRGSLMLDFVFVAMFAVVPLMAFNIYLVKYRRQYNLHKQLQILLGLILAAAVGAFEIDMRFFTDWEALAEPSPYYIKGAWDAVWISLCVHLCFAIPTLVLWIYVIVQACRKFPNPPTPSPYSTIHIFWARIAAFGMTMTAVTGWAFYYMAFVA